MKKNINAENNRNKLYSNQDYIIIEPIKIEIIHSDKSISVKKNENKKLNTKVI